MGYKQLDLNGKVAVVVGGSSGIGKTIALGLAQAGADVVASARRIDLVKELADELLIAAGRGVDVALKSDLAIRIEGVEVAPEAPDAPTWGFGS